MEFSATILRYVADNFVAAYYRTFVYNTKELASFYTPDAYYFRPGMLASSFIVKSDMLALNLSKNARFVVRDYSAVWYPLGCHIIVHGTITQDGVSKQFNQYFTLFSGPIETFRFPLCIASDVLEFIDSREAPEKTFVVPRPVTPVQRAINDTATESAEHDERQTAERDGLYIRGPKRGRYVPPKRRRQEDDPASQHQRMNEAEETEGDNNVIRGRGGGYRRPRGRGRGRGGRARVQGSDIRPTDE